ncbi:hypothetical protein [Streptomyces sp. NPDC048560]|uniref:hypothetical protein n=1 Tax=Streptomyces sp. NPDC048560 TaxID=3155488 RepID=UPI003444FDD3
MTDWSRLSHAYGSAEDIPALLDEHLRVAADRSEYVYLLEDVLSFEGVAGWSEDLAWGLTNEEYEISCPGCAAGLFIVLGERGFFSTSGDYALSDDDMETKPLLPADPVGLTGIGRRLHDVALADGQDQVANMLTYVFGEAICPDCEAHFSVAARVSDSWSVTLG